MAATMRAAFLHGVGDVRVTETPRPNPAPGELLLKVRAVSLCGSDRHYYLEGGIGAADIRSPIILGHEYAAEVIDVPEGIPGLAPGSLVAVEPARPCGHCEWCLHGHPNLCPHVRFAGSPPNEHGALAEYAVTVPECLFPLPPRFGAAEAALLEPLGVAIHALDLAHLRPMDSVAILGAGAIGLLMLQVARLAGASRTVVIDPIPERTALARELGADAAGADWRLVQDETAGRGVDVVLEATDSPTAPSQCTEVARIGGRVILAGIPDTGDFCLQAATLRRKGLTLKAVRRMKHTYPRAIQMAQSERVHLKPLITHRFSLADAADAFARHASREDGAIRVIITMDT